MPGYQVPQEGVIQRSFGGGELAPALHARADQVKYATGLRRCRNFYVRREGGVSNRAGTEFIAACKTASPTVELFPYLSEIAGESILIECGGGYLRFFRNGAAVNVAAVAAWSAVVTYGPGDVVSNGGVNYWAKIASLNQAPPSATFWHPLVGTLLELPTDFGADLPYWSQSGRVITLTHKDHPPVQLTYFSLATWSITPVVTQPSISPPTGVLLTGAAAPSATIGASSVANPSIIDTLTPMALTTGDSVTIAGHAGSTPAINGTHVIIVIDPTHFSIPVNVTVAGAGGTATQVVTGTRHSGYVVTAKALETYEESLASGQVILAGAVPPSDDSPEIITWDAQAEAAEFDVYSDPYGNGVYGLIGTAIGTSFSNPGILPNFLKTPPLPRTLFTTADDYPAVSGSHQQRRLFGYTNRTPDAIWGSRIGFPSNFSISSPLQDDDAISFKMAGAQHNPVRHIVDLKTLVILTDAGEWSVKGDPATGLGPTSINPDQETYVGCHKTKPVVVGNSVIYVQARGSIPRDLQFNQQVEGLGGRDLSLYSSHLVDGHTIRSMAFAQAPNSIVWFVRDDGVLLGLTYIREEDVWGWHRHDSPQNGTDGHFWDVCVVPEADQDAVYVIVRRTINGATVRYIERLARRSDQADWVETPWSDSALTYDGVPVTNIAGLGHLEGQVVAVFADGAAIFDGDPTAANAAAFTVTAGTLPVNLAAAASRITVGLQIVGEVETLDLDVAGGDVREKAKVVNAVDLLLMEPTLRAFLIGPRAADLLPYKAAPYEATEDEATPAEALPLASFTKVGRVLIRHSSPGPITILGIVPHLGLGG